MGFQKGMNVCILSWALADAQTCNHFECESVGKSVTTAANVATAMIDRMMLSKPPMTVIDFRQICIKCQVAIVHT